MLDYSPLDQWCRRPTWYTGHPSDLQERKAAVDELIRQPGFDPADAAAYVRANHSDGIWAGKDGDMEKAIREFEAYARKRMRG